MIDPPWQFRAGVSGRHAGSKYPLMTLDAIKAMPIRDIMAKDSLIVLWALHSMPQQALDVLKAWRATFATSGVWVKKTPKNNLAFGAGFWLRAASEPFYIAKIGRPRVHSRNIRGVIEGPVREHSRKPDEAYAAFARLVPEGLPKIEVFSRENRPGWEVFGNEEGKFNGL